MTFKTKEQERDEVFAGIQTAYEGLINNRRPSAAEEQEIRAELAAVLEWIEDLEKERDNYADPRTWS